MLRRLVCAGLLVGEAACWVLLRERQFLEPGLGLWFAPVRALRPLIHVVGQTLVLLLSFLGMLAGMLLVLGGIAVAVGATFGWIAVVVSPGTSSALTRAAAVLSGAFGLLLLVGLWGIHGAEKPPPFDWLLLLYPTGLAGSFPLLWPWNDEFST